MGNDMKNRIVKICLFTLFVGIFFLGCTSTKKKTPHDLIREKAYDAAMMEFDVPRINEPDENGNTVLHLAAEINNTNLISFFISKGADPLLKNNKGETPLHVAIEKRSFEAARILSTISTESLFSRNNNDSTAIDLGFQTDDAFYDIFISVPIGEVRDENGQSIVHYFVRTKNLKAIQKCIEKGIPLSVKDKYDKTPLDIAFDTIDEELSVDIAAELIMGGAEEVKSDFSYFQDAVSNRNMNMRFEDGQTPLHLAAIIGHTSIARYLLENNAETYVQDSSGATPLHEAVRYGNIDIIKLLLNAGANINAKDNLGKTPVMVIMPQDKINEIYSIMQKHNADLSEKDMYGDTVLHNAAMMNVSSEVVLQLINGGADVNARNKEGVTPLEIAVQKGNLNLANYLTVYGANIHTQDTKGRSPLKLALEADNKMLEAILKRENSTSQDTDGNTPLHIALINDVPLSKIQYIVSLTDDVNIRNKDGNSPLFLTVLKNRQKVGELLLAKNADIFSTNTNNNSPLRLALKYGGSVQDWLITSNTISARDGSGNSVLHYAAEWQYGDAISSLLSKGADIHAKNANGETCLFSAAKTNNASIIKLLIDGGADIYARDNLGSTAMHVAVRWEAPRSVDALIQAGLSVNVQNRSGKSPLAEAVISSKYSMAKKLLSYGADPNCSDENGVTVLMDAIRGGNKDNVKILLSFGANPNVQEINGQNAYHEAAFMGDKEIIKIIREAGGNPLARDKKGRTPFSIVLPRSLDVIKEVLGDNVNITDTDGNTPVHIVAGSNTPKEVLLFLIENGYPIDTRNADGYTPLNYSIEKEDMNSVLVLLENGANPFQMIDKKGRNGVTIALEKENMSIINNIVKYAGNKTDIQGNTILHYAARISSKEVVSKLLSFGLDTGVKNVSGDTAYVIATRWKRPEIAALLK